MAWLFPGCLVPALSTTGVIISGAKLNFYLAGTLTPTPTYTSQSLTTQNPWPVEANSAGRWPKIYLDPNITYRAKATNAADSDTLYDVDHFSVALPTNVALYSVLAGTGGAALIGASDGNTVQYHLDQAPALGIGLFNSFVSQPPNLASNVIQAYSSGWSANGVGIARYIYDAAVNAAYVAAWPHTAFLAADGRGFRIDPKQQLHLEMGGGKCDTPVAQFTYTAPAFAATRSITPGTDNLAPLLELIKVGGGYIYSFYRKCQPIHCLGGNEGNAYYFSDTIVPPVSTHLIGNVTGHYLMGGSVFLFPANTGGIKLLINTDGTGASATGSTIQGIYFFGSGGSDRSEHGFTMRAACVVRDCCFEAFPGDGINNTANGNVAYPNVNLGSTSGARLERIMLRRSC